MCAYMVSWAAAAAVLVGYFSIWSWSLRLSYERHLETSRAAFYHDPDSAGRVSMMLLDLDFLGEHRAAIRLASSRLTGGPLDDGLELMIADDEWAEGHHAKAQAERAIVARSKSHLAAAQARYDLAHPAPGA
ncbi:MAG: hypothetical protein KGK12_07210 [Armatimonadetes bacterium]|nr:hypothetical protein [Armatimonadota bacterium]